MKNKLITYKGFDKNLKCKDHQYNIGETYEMNEMPVKCTDKGFHSCENPFDVFKYYAPGTSRFSKCEAGGEIDNGDNTDSKLASSKITILSEINLDEIIKIGIDKIISKINFSKSKNTNSGDRGAAFNSGDSGAASNSGDSGAASNSGNWGAAFNSGDRGVAFNSGDRGAASNSGDRGAASNSGYSGAASNSGYRGAASNSGYRGAAFNSGDRGAAFNSGDSGAASNSGDRGVASNSGYWGAASNSGDSGAAFNSGYRGAASTEGRYSIACGLGFRNKAKGSVGSWIILADRQEDGIIKDIKSTVIDGVEIKGDTWYELRDGQFTIAE